MKTPKEDPKDKADRERERRISLLERRKSGQENAASMSSDISRVYGLGGLRFLGQAGTATAGPPPALNSVFFGGPAPGFAHLSTPPTPPVKKPTPAGTGAVRKK